MDFVLVIALHIFRHCYPDNRAPLLLRCVRLLAKHYRLFPMQNELVPHLKGALSCRRRFRKNVVYESCSNNISVTMAAKLKMNTNFTSLFGIKFALSRNLTLIAI